MLVRKTKRLAMKRPKLVTTGVLLLVAALLAQDPVAADVPTFDPTGGAEVDNGP